MTDRVRVSALADQIGVPFPHLFSALCRTMPAAVDDMLTVSAVCAETLRDAAPMFGREAR